MDIREMAVDFEAVLKGFSKLSGGMRGLRFTVQADDVTQDVDDLEINSRYRVALVKIGDDEQPAPKRSNLVKLQHRRTKISDLSGIAREKPEFRGYLFDRFGREDLYLASDRDQYKWVMDTLHEHCGCASFSGVEEDSPAGKKFLELYDDWKAEGHLP